MTARRGDWCQVYSGLPFWPLDPRPEEVRITDIAHALALQCRFGGHCAGFYSVAEHSVRVSRACDPQDALWGLLHDAAEAYLVDVPRPLKRDPAMEAYRLAEKRLMECICECFGLPKEMPESVHRADQVLLATEKRDLMRQGRKPWEELPDPLEGHITPWSPERAESEFASRFAILRLEARGLELSW